MSNRQGIASKTIRTVLRILLAIFRHENTVLGLILLVLIGTLAIITGGLTLSKDNLVNIALQSSSRGVASIGQAFVILTAGIDVSIGGVGLLLATLGGAMMTQAMHLNIIGHTLPIAPGIIFMLVAGFALGLFNGAFTSYLRVPALITTLAVWRMATGASFLVAHAQTIMDLPRSLAFLGQGYIGTIPISVIIFIGVAAVAFFILKYTGYGRSVYAVGGNPESAWLSGINVKRTTLLAYGISGLLAGLAAVITLSRSLTASMVTLNGLELDTIAAVVIGGISLSGGRGSIIGVVIGVIILGVINNGMNIIGVGPALQDLIKGAIILTAVTIDVVRRNINGR